MRRRKLMLALLALVMFLVVGVGILAPSTARAQGLVEYALCQVFAQDTGSNIGNPDLVEFLEATFDIDWSDEYGAIGYCIPSFTGRDKVFSGFRSYLVAYVDVDGDGYLSPGDTELKRVQQNFRF